ncbi:MAG: hypothetical protein ACRDQW_19010 [Haloechinothrix sp.]
MPTETQTAEMTELELLHRFVAEQLAHGGRKMTVEECLAEFREYREKLEWMREAVRPALERSRRGESKPFDRAAVEALKERVTRELAEKGITD